jgi:serine/threonine-protein kinase RsbW
MMKKTATFPGRYDHLEKISAWVEQATKTAGFDDSASYGIQLAVDEACTNIIEHAYGGEDRGDIEITCEMNEEALRILLRDFGQSFDPDAVPTPQLNVPIEELEDQGLGLHWMRKLMDEVRFEFSSETGNLLTLVKHRPKPSEG